MASWVTYDGNKLVSYTPSADDLDDYKSVEKLLPKEDALTQAVAAGVMRGVGGALGDTYNAATPPEFNHDSEVILCKHHKIYQSDVDRMKAQVQQSQRDLGAAEAALDQAKQAYSAALKQIVDDHITLKISLPPTVNINNPVSLCGAVPELAHLKMQEQRAASEYNNRLFKLGQEQVLYRDLERQFEKEATPDKFGNFVLIIAEGFWAFVMNVFSAKF